MSSNPVRVEIPDLDIQSVAREAIAAKLTEAMGGDVIRKIVYAAMATKVNSNGVVSRYSSDNKMSQIEWMAGNLIRSAAQQALTNMIKEMQLDIERAVEEALKASMSEIARFLVARLHGEVHQLRITIGSEKSVSKRASEEEDDDSE